MKTFLPTKTSLTFPTPLANANSTLGTTVGNTVLATLLVAPKTPPKKRPLIAGVKVKTSKGVTIAWPALKELDSSFWLADFKASE